MTEVGKTTGPGKNSSRPDCSLPRPGVYKSCAIHRPWLALSYKQPAFALDSREDEQRGERERDRRCKPQVGEFSIDMRLEGRCRCRSLTARYKTTRDDARPCSSSECSMRRRPPTSPVSVVSDTAATAAADLTDSVANRHALR